LCYTEAAFIKKIQARGGQCGEIKGIKSTKEKIKGEREKTKE
jgi:hypothetical protein